MNKTKKIFRTTLYKENWLQQRYEAEGKTSHEIGTEIGCPASTVIRALRRLGISVRHEAKPSEQRECANPRCSVVFIVGGKGNRPRSALYHSRECHMQDREAVAVDTLHQQDWLCQKYIVERLSTVQIANLCECAVRTVCRALRRFEIPIRSRTESAIGKTLKPVGELSKVSSVENSRQRNRIAHQKMKMEMIEAYGGKCACCGESEPAFLSLDHINGGGIADRKNSGGQQGIFRRLRELGWPQDDYRCLCMNCNTATKYGRACPHQQKKES